MPRAHARNLILLAALVLSACQDQTGPQYREPGERYATTSAPVVVHLPGPEAVRDDFLSLVVNLEGMEGLLGLIEGATGLDFANLSLLTDAGLDSAMPGRVFAWRSGWVAVFGLSDAAGFEDFLLELSKGEGWDFRKTRSEGGLLFDMPEVALAVEGNLLTVYRGPDARGQLAALMLEARPESFEARDGEGYDIELKLGRQNVESLLTDWYDAAGMAAGVVRALARYIDGCAELRGNLTMGDRILLDATAAKCTTGFQREPLMTPEDYLVDDTVFLLHVRLPEETLWDALAPVIRYAVADWWRELPGKRPEGMAELGPLLSRVDGEVALAFLGLSAQANLDTFIGSSDELAPLFGIHWQLLVTLRDGETMDELFDAETMKTLLPQYEPRGLGAGDILASEYCRPKTQKASRRCFTAARQGQTLMVVTGEGEGDRLVRTLRGQSQTLGKSLFARQAKGPVTMTLKTRRLVKDLMSKGFPPYFLQILSSILEVRLTISDREDGTHLAAEVVLR